MTPAEAPDPAPLNQALRRIHWSVLGTLAVCAALIGATTLGDAGASAAPGARIHSLVALALAAGAILVRRSVPTADARGAVARSVVSMLLAGGLGVLGVVVATQSGDARTGLLYTLAGALLSLRPPPRLQARRAP